ncbi:unnamed protein product [Parajaminaea phylloscopi]
MAGRRAREAAVGRAGGAMASSSRQWEQPSSDEEGEGSQLGSLASEEDEGQDAGSDHEEEDAASAGSSAEEAARPHYAQFQGESDLEEELSAEGSSESEDSDEDDEGDLDSDGEDGGAAAQEKMLKQKLASIPFGELVKARQSLQKRGGEESEEDDYSEEDEWAADRARAASKGGKPNGSDDHRRDAGRNRRARNDDNADEVRARAWPARKEMQHRSNKHAPTEVSSRKPVSRKRSVIDAVEGSSGSQQRRDPRFSNLSGHAVNEGMFAKSYSFLAETQTKELSELRQTHSKLRKMEANHAGPKAKSQSALDIRQERERVERALKREEAKDAERKKRSREKEVLRNFRLENDERVKNGGKRFYLKDSAKKELFLQDKFSKLANGGRKAPAPGGEGGQTPAASSSKALRKALDKRRKKNAAKERKHMPFLEAGRRGGGGGGGGGNDMPESLPIRKRGPDAGRDGRSGDSAPKKRKRGVRGSGN